MIEISRREAAAPRSARIHHVLHVRDISPSAFVLRFSREGLEFQAGQWINLGLPRSRDQREYTVYSSPSDEFLEVLVKEIPDGTVSPALRRCRPGDPVEVEGPHGSFTLVQGARESARFLFCATGTGVSPFQRSGPGDREAVGGRVGGDDLDHQRGRRRHHGHAAAGWPGLGARG